jgi:hypothetical protein
MAAGSTYEPIATTTVGTATSTVTFSSIPGTYTDLVVVISGTSSILTGIGTQFNGDTGTNYSRVLIQGNGTTASSSVETSQTFGTWGLLDTVGGNSVYNIMNYANATTYKTIISRANVVNGALVRGHTGLWRSTAAITSITFMYSTFSTGTTLSIYGIAAA